MEFFPGFLNISYVFSRDFIIYYYYPLQYTYVYVYHFIGEFFLLCISSSLEQQWKNEKNIRLKYDFIM